MTYKRVIRSSLPFYPHLKRHLSTKGHVLLMMVTRKSEIQKQSFRNRSSDRTLTSQTIIDEEDVEVQRHTGV